MRSSPRASMGLSMLPASIAPSAAPAPTTVCSSSMNVTISPSLCLISFRTALSRSSNSPRYLAPGHHGAQVERDDPLAAQRLGHVAGHDPLGQALDDGGLADARLADEHRVVLGPAGQHLDHPADLGVPADDRVELAVPGPRGQVDAVLLQRLVGALGVLRRDPGAARAPARTRRAARPGGARLAQQRGAPGRRPRPARPAGARSRRTRRPARLARLAAVASTVSSCREVSGAPTVGPAALGSRASISSASLEHRSRVGADRCAAAGRRCRPAARPARPAGAGRRRSGCRPRRPAGRRRTAPPGSSASACHPSAISSWFSVLV